MMIIVSTHNRNWCISHHHHHHHHHHHRQHSLLFGGRFNNKVSRFGDYSAPILLFRISRRKFSPVLSAKVIDPDESESEDDDDDDDNKADESPGSSSNDQAGGGGVNSEMVRRNLERIVGADDSSFSGIDLATLIRDKYGRSYDVQLIKKEFMGRNLLALNVMWKYREQKSFPLTEEEYLLRLDDANTLKCWGAVSHIRNSLANSKERPRIGKAVSIFIDMDETGGRANEWIYNLFFVLNVFSIITSKDFIHSHLRASSEKGIHRKLLHNDAIWSKVHTLDINDGSIEEFVPDFDIPHISPRDAAYCNGLLLISNVLFSKLSDEKYSYDFKFSIWNPSTRCYREIPTFPEKLVNPPYSPILPSQTIRKVSFGYDPTSDDYKVVLIISKNQTYQVWILELRSSCWRNINLDVAFEDGQFDFEPGFDTNCFVDGCVHFLWRARSGYPYTFIMAFDIAEETFFRVPHHQPTNYQPIEFPLLQVFEGCLCIGVCTEKNVDIYVRKKEGAEFSWTKLFSFSRYQFLEPRFVRILGYTKGRDKILFICSTSVMYSYDLKERSL